MNCHDLHNSLQQRLEGLAPACHADADAHLASCPACRELHSAALGLEKGLRLLPQPLPPAGFANRVVSQVLAEQQARLRLRNRALTLTAAAAGLLLALVGGYYWLRPGSVDHPQLLNEVARVESQEPAVPSLDEDIAEAGSAVVALTRRTADETVGKSRLLLPEAMPPTTLVQTDVLQKTWEPSAQSLRQAGQGISTGLEPVATSARRAFNLFLVELNPMAQEAPANKPEK